METRIIDLGTLENGTVSFGIGISNNGNVVVGRSTTNGAIGTRAFRWQNGSMIKLTGLDANAVSAASGVNIDGTIIAGGTVVSGVYRAWRFANNAYTSIGNLGHATSYSFAYDMSMDGTVITGESRRADGIYRAFRWDTTNGITDLGTLGGGYTSSIGLGISPSGTYIVGYAYGGGQSQKAFVWTSSGGMVGLNYPSPAGLFARAYAVSSNGIIVGISAFSNVEVGTAFAYQNGTYTNLGRIPGYSFSLATDISLDGSVIVGYSYNTSVANNALAPITAVSAFRYANGVMTNIGDLGTYTTPAEVLAGYSTGRDGGIDDPTLNSFAYTVSGDGDSLAGTSEVRMPNSSIEQHAFLYKLIRIQQKPYYDDNQKYVAQAKDNQTKFSDASSYTQFLKARASGNMYRYQG